MLVLQHSYVRKVNRNLQGRVRFPTGSIAHEPVSYTHLYMLLMHAEDQLMSAEAFRILADEFITR